ncbi:MAG: hypothetical protein ACRYGI_11695 [Janthinobacterium lividum]
MSAAGERHLLVFGLGYSAMEVARLAVEAGYRVTGTTRRPDVQAPAGVTLVRPEAALDLLDGVTHLLAGAPPGEDGDPILAMLATRPGACRPGWIGYFSTTGVYGDRQGGWVDETTEPAPTGPRGKRRLEAELAWETFARSIGSRLDLLRIAGIYGPGRSAFDSLRAGTARRVDAPGHAFGRIHRDDIAGATLAAMHTDAGRDGNGRRVLNLNDDLPEESAVVTAAAARMLGMAPPVAVPLDQALAEMSEMGQSFWAENRKVASRMTQGWLGWEWLYPTYREGLFTIQSFES